MLSSSAFLGVTFSGGFSEVKITGVVLFLAIWNIRKKFLWYIFNKHLLPVVGHSSETKALMSPSLAPDTPSWEQPYVYFFKL